MRLEITQWIRCFILAFYLLQELGTLVQLLESYEIGVLPEASTAHVEAILSNETVGVSTDPARGE